MSILIKLENGRWTVNGRGIDQMTEAEYGALCEFFAHAKTEINRTKTLQNENR